MGSGLEFCENRLISQIPHGLWGLPIPHPTPLQCSLSSEGPGLYKRSSVCSLFSPRILSSHSLYLGLSIFLGLLKVPPHSPDRSSRDTVALLTRGLVSACGNGRSPERPCSGAQRDRGGFHLPAQETPNPLYLEL